MKFLHLQKMEINVLPQMLRSRNFAYENIYRFSGVYFCVRKALVLPLLSGSIPFESVNVNGQVADGRKGKMGYQELIFLKGVPR